MSKFIPLEEAISRINKVSEEMKSKTHILTPACSFNSIIENAIWKSIDSINSLPTLELSEDNTSPYINREELKAFLKSRCYNQKTLTGWVELALSPTVIQEIDSLPTLEDKTIQKIDAMIEGIKSTPVPRSMNNQDYKAHYAKIEVLEELKKKLYPNK